MKKIIRVSACVLALMLVLICAASAKEAPTVSMSGRLQPERIRVITAPMTGSVSVCETRTGDKLTAGESLMTIDTVCVYAPCDGTVAGLRVQEGDSIAPIAALYGAAMYIEPTSLYMISASTTNAYESNDNRIIHVGETVYLTSVNNSNRVGKGLIISVSGENYIVEVTESNIRINETCRISRVEDSEKSSGRIGQGKTQRNNPMPVTAEGSVVRLHVAEGEQVRRGDLLMEIAPDYLNGAIENEVKAEYDCIVLAVMASEGSVVQKGQPIAQVFEAETLQAVVLISEDDLPNVNVGDEVDVMLDLDPDEYSYRGTIEHISYVPAESVMGTMYEVTVSFRNDDFVRMGMSITVETR